MSDTNGNTVAPEPTEAERFDRAVAALAACGYARGEARDALLYLQRTRARTGRERAGREAASRQGVNL